MGDRVSGPLTPADFQGIPAPANAMSAVTARRIARNGRL
jgi:hypothetical protein